MTDKPTRLKRYGSIKYKTFANNNRKIAEAYIAGLKDDPAPAALFDADGKMAVPEAYTRERTEKKRGD